MSSGAVDTKTVEMRFDNSDFEKNAKQSMSTLERLKHALKLDGASAGLREVERASKKLDFRDFKGNIDGVGKRFSVLETIATGALLRIGSAAADTGLRIAKSMTVDQVAAGWNKYEQKITSVQTIMANLRDAQDKFTDEASKMDYVNKYLDKLMWFSDETSYSFTEMTDNVGKFIANGQGLEDSVTAMQGIATWAAISGQRSQSAARAMYNISQAMGTGAMKMIDWKSIENANMATAEFKETAINAAVAMGKLQKGQVTIESFRDSLQKGWFDKDVMMNVFNQYGEAANKIQEYTLKTGKTATEVIREIREGNKKVAEEVGVTADSLGFRALTAAQEAKTFTEVLEATADAVSTKWLRIFENIFGNYLEAKELWSNFAEDLWDIFAGPLDTVNDVMSAWNRGFFQGPVRYLDRMYERGVLDKIENGLGIKYITKEAAEAAVAADGATYSIEKLADGTERFWRNVKTSSGEIRREYKYIYEGDKKLVSGRTVLVEGFKNVLDTFIHDVEGEDGKFESISIFGSIKRGLQEVIFGTSEADELVPKLSRKIWELTLGFRNLTERLKPSLETSNKIKNAFKGLFTLFKIGGKFVKAVIKPFKDLFKEIFTKKEGSKGLLDLADSMGTWIQKLDQFLDKNQVFDKVSKGIRTGIDWIKSGVDTLIQSMTGMSSTDFFADIKTKVFGFFENYDFETTLSNIGGFFRGIIDDIKQVNTGELEGELTPLQNFWLGVKGIFEGMKKFFTLISPAFRWIGDFVKNVFTSISDAITNRKGTQGVKKASPIWEGIKKVFGGIADFFEKVGPTLEKVGTWIGDFFRDLGDAISTWAKDKSPEEIIESIVKGGFIISLTNLINSISGLASGGGKIGKAIAGDLDAIKGVLRAYQREINVSTLTELALSIAILAGSMWILAQIPAGDMKRAGDALLAIGSAIAAFSLAKDGMKVLTNLANKTDTGKALTSDGPLAALKNLMVSTVQASIFANDATAKFVKIALGVVLAALAAKVLVDAVAKAGKAIAELSTISPDQLKQGGKVAGLIIAAFSVFSLFSGLSFRPTTAVFAALGAILLVKAVIKLTDYMAALGNNRNKIAGLKLTLDTFKGVLNAAKELIKIVAKFTVLVLIAQIIMSALSAASLTGPRGLANAMKQFGKNFMRIALSMIVVALAFTIMANAIKDSDPKNTTAALSLFEEFVIAVGGILAVVAGIAALASAEKAAAMSLVLKQFGKTFTRIAASLLIVAIAFGLMTLVAKASGANATAVAEGIFTKFIRAVVIMLAAVSLFASFAKEGTFTWAVIKQLGNAFLKIAASLAVVAIAFGIMTGIAKASGANATRVAEGIFTKFVAAVGIMMVLLVGLTAWSNKDAFVYAAIKQLGNTFLKIAASLVIVAAAFGIFAYILSKESGADAIKMATGPLAAFVLAVGTVSAVLAGIVRTADLKSGANIYHTIKHLGNTFLKVALSLVVVAAAFAIMANIDFSRTSMRDIEGIFGAFILVVALLAGLGAVIGHFGEWEALQGIGAICLVVLSAALALTLVSIGFATLAKNASVKKLEEIRDILMMFGVVLAVLIGIGMIAGTFGGFGGIIGILAVAGVILSIGAACLMAAVGIAIIVVAFGLFANGLANLVEAVATYGPEFAANIDMVLKAALEAIINNADLFAEAGEVIITSFVKAIGNTIKAGGKWIGNKFKDFWNTLVESMNVEIDEHGFPVEPEVDVEPKVEVDESAWDEVKGQLDSDAADTYLTYSPTADVKASEEAGAKNAEAYYAGFEGAEDKKANLEKKLESKPVQVTTDSAANKAVGEQASTEALDVVSGMIEQYAPGKGEELVNAIIGGATSAEGEEAAQKSGLASFFTNMLTGGTVEMPDLTSVFGDSFSVENLTTIFQGKFGEVFGGLDLSQYGVSGIESLASGYSDNIGQLDTAATDMKSSITTPLSEIDGYTSGYDLGSNMADGINDSSPLVEKACTALANLIHSILGFSEPETGPLSDFHTYAPDMVKLWCKGVYDNLGSVESSATDFADTVYDGFSTALDYVSDLIDNGMSDQLTIRPVMDLSEIQNGVDSMYGMMSSANGYEITGTTRLAASSAYGMRGVNDVPQTTTQTIQSDSGPISNTFYITNGDPNAVAEKVSKILSQQTRRQKAVWAK